MSVETELKLRIAPEQINRLKRHHLLRTLATARAVTHQLHNVYFDTPDLGLRKQAMALRLRRIGKHWLQTLKGGGGVQAGLHRRNEWETPVSGAALDFAALKAGGAPRLAPALRKKLQPVFVTDFSRTVRQLNFEGAAIEMCMDSGEIRAGTKSRPISEIELELKSGEPQQLFKLALALLDSVALEVEHTSKAEYGYRLFAGMEPAVLKAPMPDLSKCVDVSCTLQSMIWSCLYHLQANVAGAVQKLDEEYLHQVRVALRRLRVVLGMVRIFRADEELAALTRQVAELCVDLGRMREWDVFVTQTLALTRERLPGHAGLNAVLCASEEMREQHHARVRDRLQSQDFQRLLLRFGAWMQSDYWRASDVGLADFAARILDRRSKQVGKRGRELAVADASQLHALRIACKKLRYSAEMFAPLYAEARVARYVDALAGLQDILGALNDIVVAHRLLDELESDELHDTLALIRGGMTHERAGLLIRLAAAWKKFAGKKAFWGRGVGR